MVPTTDPYQPVLPEIGVYLLPGHSDSPRDALAQVRDAEAMGIGAAFISERFNVKDAAVMSGAAAAVTERIGLATSVTNHNTRHPLVTATIATTMHRLSGGRFALGLGRGVDRIFARMGLPSVTTAQLEDFVDVMRRLWHGEAVVNHDGPAGRWSLLVQDRRFDEDIPVMMAGFGERTLEFAGRVVDGVFLHTFFSDAAVTRCVAAVRRGAERAGRDPDRIRIWSVLAVVDGSLDEATLLKKVVGRMGSYLQGYGDLMVGVNGWDPAALERFRADEVVQSIVRTGAIDAIATTDQLRHIEELIPPEWTAPAAVGTPEERAAEIARQFELGVTDVICHGVTPAELPAVLEAYRALRPPRNASRTEVNPGRAP